VILPLPSPHWSRVLITALLILPLVLIVALSAPAWLVWPFLPESRCDAVLKFLGNLIDWVKAIAGPDEHKPIADSAAVDEPGPDDGPQPPLEEGDKC
jgi:hypothetical protein